MDIEKNNDDMNNRKRLWGKNSLLYNANANHHSQRNKRSATEQRLKVDGNIYWGDICSHCSHCNNKEENCLIKYFSGDWNQLRVAANNKLADLEIRTIDEHNEEVHNNLMSLGTKHNKSNSHTVYKVSLVQGVQIECCKECYMRFNYITKHQLEKSKKISKINSNIDINARKDRERQDGPVIDMNGIQFKKLLEKNNSNNKDFIDEFLPYAFAPQGDTHEYCLQWMKDYFDKYGDKQPNSYITFLSEAFKRDIYDQYCSHVSKHRMVSISKDSFYRMWINCFPYKLLREEGNIIGKCPFVQSRQS